MKKKKFVVQGFLGKQVNKTIYCFREKKNVTKFFQMRKKKVCCSRFFKKTNKQNDLLF